MIHRASPDFWKLFDSLPQPVQANARRAFALLKKNPRHPSLRLKRVGRYWSARVGRGYRALGKSVEGGVLWGWIGTHDDYDRII